MTPAETDSGERPALLPEGFRYETEILTVGEEAELARHFEARRDSITLRRTR